MKKLTIVIWSIILTSQFLFSQVVANLDVSKELYFGPKNVYPISFEICQSYIEYLTAEQIKESENPAVEEQNQIKIFNKQLDILKGEWKRIQTALDSIIKNDNYCFIQIIDDTEFTGIDLEINKNIEKGEVEITEYIDKSKVKLPKIKWEKTAVKNCLSSNPDDCYVWCKVEFVKLFLDSSNEKLDTKLLTNELDFIEDKTRISRTIIIDIGESETFELHNINKEYKYSVVELKKSDCN
jgi:hypothetical protein